MSTDIAVHILKSDFKFKQNDKKENIYLCWFFISGILFSMLVRLHGMPAFHAFVILIDHVTR